MMTILIVDDQEESRNLLNRVLKSGGGYEVVDACNGLDALEKARQNPPHLIISDLLMPVMDGYTLLRHWRADARLKHIPFIVHTATYVNPKDEQLALSLGADAFILKPAEPAELLERVRQVLANPAVFGMTSPPVSADTVSRIPVQTPAEDETTNFRNYSEVLIRKLEDKMEQLDRANRELQMDVASRKEMEAVLRTLSSRQNAILAAVPTIIMEVDDHKVYTWANSVGLAFFGDDVIGKEAAFYFEGEQTTYQTVQPLFTGQQEVAIVESWQRRKDGEKRLLFWQCRALKDEGGNITGVLSSASDITEHRQLEEQFRQAQKLEAIGQLAGGVAHDFNNLLTVIQGNASLLLEARSLTEPEADSARQIVEAAERAAGLTRQLLLFSRKQAMQPVLMNLNEAVGNMTRMLQRILGEDITLRSDYAPNLPFIYADVGMIEQILLNLAVNARDAMPGGGRLQITTSVETISKEYAQQNPDATEGECVCLSVNDTGCGIPPENMPRIFDPFFTTKEIGKGSGLGLATTYGIVKQHRGWIDVTSQVGNGTTFRIFLPAAQGVALGLQTGSVAAALPRGDEVIMIVEDEPAVRVLVSNMLQRCGYTVLLAASGVAALEVWKKHKAEIQLLLTDVVMPDGMTGRELMDRLKKEKPELKVICTSGYSDDVVGKGQALLDGITFLQKPYSPLKLARIVRDGLDQK